MIFQFQWCKREGSNNDKAPADQRELQGTFRPPLFGQFREPDRSRGCNKLNDQNRGDQTCCGEPENYDAKDTRKSRHRIDAINEAEVGNHVDEQRAEFLDAREGFLDFTKGHHG